MDVDSKWASRGGGLVIGALLLGTYLLLAVGCSSDSVGALESIQTSRSESETPLTLLASGETNGIELGSLGSGSEAGHGSGTTSKARSTADLNHKNAIEL
ncbi:MAG: hypothetical protein HQ478_16540 [Chloroflexi bacterium]|nr:hypothetical protein [Chloroflexota bacterium]